MKAITVSEIEPAPTPSPSPETDRIRTQQIQRVFQALSSQPRRKILAYLSAGPLAAGDIAKRFDMAKPSVSQHLSLLEAAGLVTSDKQGQFVYYQLAEHNLTNTVNSYLQEVCPVARPLKYERDSK